MTPRPRYLYGVRLIVNGRPCYAFAARLQDVRQALRDGATDPRRLPLAAVRGGEQYGIDLPTFLSLSDPIAVC